MATGHRRFVSRTVGILAATAVLLGSAGVASLAAGAGTAGVSSVRATTAPRSAPTVIKWAELPDEFPNWIFPFAGLQYYSTTNLQQFQYLMYRPLYWLGDNGKPALNTTLSLAGAPSYSDGDSVVTIPLKSWQWSNSTPVDAQDVVFFMNMLRSEASEWAGSAPGELPYNVVSVTAASATSDSVSIRFNRGYNTTWILFNELGQITPMPLAWDISKLQPNGQPAAPGSGGCSSMTWNSRTRADCKKVWKFMTDDNGQSSDPQEAADLHTYASNPLWQVVDGPWRLASFDGENGELTMVPNTKYSGSVKPHVDEFEEVPFTSYQSEYAALKHDKLTVGYLPSQFTPPAPSPGTVGPNAPSLAGNYQLSALYPWQVNYFPINLNSTGDGGVAGAIFHQLYLRRALQELVDQPKMISAVYKNYATADDGPVPTRPASAFLSSAERHNPYAYDPSAAASMLTANGWTVKKGGTDVCSASAGCGSGVPAGSKLSFKLVYLADNSTVQSQVTDIVKSWSDAGIHVATKAEPFDEVIGTAAPCKPSAQCSWEMADWGGGWIYLPDIEPTGDLQFQTGAGSNSGSYSDPKNDKLIRETITSNATGIFQTWENYLTNHVPVIWQPMSATVIEISKSVRRVEPLDPYYSLTPEYWSFRS